MRQISLNHAAANKFAPTFFAYSANPSLIDVGYENSIVALLKGDFIKEKHISSRIVHEGNEPLSALGFINDGIETFLVIATINKMFGLKASSSKQSAALLYSFDQKPTTRVAAITPFKEIAVADDIGIEFYNTTRKLFTFSFDGIKHSIYFFKAIR